MKTSDDILNDMAVVMETCTLEDWTALSFKLLEAIRNEEEKKGSFDTIDELIVKAEKENYPDEIEPYRNVIFNQI